MSQHNKEKTNFERVPGTVKQITFDYVIEGGTNTVEQLQQAIANLEKQKVEIDDQILIYQDEIDAMQALVIPNADAVEYVIQQKAIGERDNVIKAVLKEVPWELSTQDANTVISNADIIIAEKVALELEKNDKKSKTPLEWATEEIAANTLTKREIIFQLQEEPFNLSTKDARATYDEALAAQG
jgi:hypothetical protein